MRIFSAIVVGFIASGMCFAHEDRHITVKSDGVLDGIPSEYGPAALRVEFSPPRAGDAPITSIRLDLGKSQTILPLCITGVLQTRSKDQVRASASWYHDESILPYYLKLDFFDPGYDDSRWANPGFTFLFNLRTGKLIQMEVSIVRDKGRSIQNLPVDLAAQCTPAELKGFTVPVARISAVA